MVYAGDTTLDPKVQQRIMTAFAEAVRLYREGHAEESLTVLRSISDVDPQFKPAQRLEAAINANAPVDLAQLLGEMSAAAEHDVTELIGKAREAFEQRDFAAAQSFAQAVLKELPGHAEARRLVLEAQARQRAAAEVETLLGRARDALEAGQVQEAQGFLRLARSLDPSHPGLSTLETRLPAPAAAEPEGEFEFEVFDQFAAGSEPGLAEPAAPSFSPGRDVTTGFEPEFEEPMPAMPSATFGAGVAAPKVTPPTPPQPAAAGPMPAPRFPEPAPAGFQVAPVVAPPRAATGPVFGGAPAMDSAGDVGGVAFDSPAADMSPRFEQAAAPVPRPMGESLASPSDRIQELLDQGQRAFDAGDYQTAIETWTRIFLLDAHHPEAELRIEQARRRREEVERLAEHRFYEAREAFEQGRLDDARALCREVLELQPQHLEAHDLLQRLETPAALPPPPVPSLPPDEEDLFKDDFVPATIASPTVTGGAVAVPAPPREKAAPVRPAEKPSRTVAGLPLPLAAAAGVALLVLVAAALFLGGKALFRGADKHAAAIGIADSLAEKGQLADAISVLESLSGQLEGEQANLVNEKIQALKRRLKARATPPPTFDVGAIRAAIDGGERLKAFRMVQEGLQKAPSEPGLVALQTELLTYSSQLSQLATALRESNWMAVRQAASFIRQQHPEDAEFERIWAVATFNAALVALRKYKVPEGHNLLGELTKQGDDPEAAKLQAFAKSYLARPTDPRYDLFVSNIELRKIE